MGYERISKNYTAEQIIGELAEEGNEFPRTVTIRLAPKATAWNPASTKTVISGPKTIIYTEYADGGIEAEWRDNPYNG